MMAAVCSFDTVHSAVDTVMQVMQCGIPVARIGRYLKSLTREGGLFMVSLLVGMKITISVLPFMGCYSSDGARSCVNDGCFDLQAFANCKISVRKNSGIDNFEASYAKTAALY